MKFTSIIVLALTYCPSLPAFIALPITRNVVRSCRSSSSSSNILILHAANDDDDRPKLSMREENDGSSISVKSFEEVKKGPSYYTPKETSSTPTRAPKPSVSFGKSVFGSMTVEDLKSRGFVRESVQKVRRICV